MDCNRLCKCLCSQLSSVTNFLTCNAFKTKILMMTFPDITLSSDCIWQGPLHLNISSSVLCFAIFLKKNASIFLLENAVLSHICIRWLKEGSIASSKLSAWARTSVVSEVSELFGKRVLDDVKSKGADVTLLGDVVIEAHFLRTVCANDTNFFFPADLEVGISGYNNTLGFVLEHHVGKTRNWCIASFKIPWASSDWANGLVNRFKNIFVPNCWQLCK